MDRNWIYRSDDHLYATRWLNILSPDIDPDFVQIISWNDYGESHCESRVQSRIAVGWLTIKRMLGVMGRYRPDLGCAAWIGEVDRGDAA